MSYDLLLKHPKHNWARGIDETPVSTAAPVAPAADKVKEQTAKLAALKASADKGDKKAQKKWAKINKKVTHLQKKAAKGDSKAARMITQIAPTGLFPALKAGTTTAGDDQLTEIISSGDDKLEEIVSSGAFVGREEILGMDEILGQFIGEEERALAAEGGACEKHALRRRFAKRQD